MLGFELIACRLICRNTNLCATTAPKRKFHYSTFWVLLKAVWQRCAQLYFRTKVAALLFRHIVLIFRFETEISFFFLCRRKNQIWREKKFQQILMTCWHFSFFPLSTIFHFTKIVAITFLRLKRRIKDGRSKAVVMGSTPVPGTDHYLFLRLLSHFVVNNELVRTETRIQRNLKVL